jgi:hypothetical protein
LEREFCVGLTKELPVGSVLAQRGADVDTTGLLERLIVVAGNEVEYEVLELRDLLLKRIQLRFQTDGILLKCLSFVDSVAVQYIPGD